MWEFIFPKDPYDTPFSHPPLELRIQNLIELSKTLGYDKGLTDSLEEKWTCCKQEGAYQPGRLFQKIVDDSIFTEVRKGIYAELHKDETWHYNPKIFNEMYAEQTSGLREENMLQYCIMDKINYQWLKAYLGKTDINDASREIVEDLT